MTSKELNEILNKTRRTKNIELSVEQVKEIIKDLEILEIIKKWSFLDTFYREDTDTTYDAFRCNIHTKGMKEDFEKVKEWLDEK